MPVQLNDAEASALIQVLGELPLSTFNTPTKKSVLNKLLSASPAIDTSKCIGNGDGAVFMLENVAPGEVVMTIKVLRAATGWGLKEAKDAYDQADPHKSGGVLGPFRSTVPTFEALTGNYAQYEAKFGRLNSGIRMVAV